MSRHYEPSFAKPARDKGLMFEGRAARERRLRRKRRQRTIGAFFLVAVGLLAAVWFLSRTAPRHPTQVAAASTTPMEMSAASAVGAPQADPTPLFATYKDIALRVPVPAEMLTEISFHQASYNYAQHLTSKLPTYPMEKAKNKKGTGRTAETSVADEQGWLGGYVLRLWRDRPGTPDTAADVGAPAGTPVLAPVTGRVLLVKAYKLYQKYPDYELHIRPSGHNDLDVVLIHIAKPVVQAGADVVGGVTQIGEVRNLSSRMRLQLSGYTKAAGDHTHVQLNRVKPGTTEGVGS